MALSQAFEKGLMKLKRVTILPGLLIVRQDGLHGEVSKQESLHLLLPYAQLQAGNVMNVRPKGGAKASEVGHVTENDPQTIPRKADCLSTLP